MIQSYFTKLAEFNVWANAIVCNWLEQITNEQWNAHVVSSFNSIQKTVLHIISAENAWVERFYQKENVARLEKTFQGTKEEHITLWKNASNKFNEFVAALDVTNLDDEFSFRRFNGELSSAKYYEAVAHAVNHSTYHRGQIVTMLRQVGYTALESTDLISFYRFIQHKN